MAESDRRMVLRILNWSVGDTGFSSCTGSLRFRNTGSENRLLLVVMMCGMRNGKIKYARMQLLQQAAQGSTFCVRACVGVCMCRMCVYEKGGVGERKESL